MSDIIKDLKLDLGERAKSIIAEGLGFKPDRTGKVLCPLHNEKRPSMSWFGEGLMWRCHSCNGHIDIFSYYTDFEHLDFKEAKDKVIELVGGKTGGRPMSQSNVMRVSKKVYDKPNIETRELSPPFIDYMNKRGISTDTLNHFKVKETDWSGSPVYVFQYFNEKNILEFVSFRALGKTDRKGGCVPNTRAILWNMNNINTDKPLVITEGQTDAMAIYEAGYSNVVSVPSGSNNLKWINYNWDWLQTVKEIIVFVDNDEPGLKMGEEIKAKLNNVKILIPERKDANEVLYFDGKDQLLRLINDCIKQTPQGLLDVSQIEYKSLINTTPFTIETGFIDYDEHVEDLKEQELTVVFGRNGEGKTTFISQVISHNLKRQVGTFLYSGEMSDNKIQDWLYRQMIGENTQFLRMIKGKYRDKVEPLPSVIKAIKEWHRGNLFLYDRSEKEVLNNLDKFFKTMDIAAKRYGVKLFIVDNLMTVLEENADSLFSDQANLVQRCKEFAINHSVHVILLAHPNKMKKEIDEVTEKGNLEKGDISGSGNIPNKADNIIAIERVWAPDSPCDAIITSLKDRETGQRKSILYKFSKDTLRFYNDRTKISETYGWELEINSPEIIPNFMEVPLEDVPF